MISSYDSPNYDATKSETGKGAYDSLIEVKDTNDNNKIYAIKKVEIINEDKTKEKANEVGLLSNSNSEYIVNYFRGGNEIFSYINNICLGLKETSYNIIDRYLNPINIFSRKNDNIKNDDFDTISNKSTSRSSSSSSLIDLSPNSPKIKYIKFLGDIEEEEIFTQFPDNITLKEMFEILLKRNYSIKTIDYEKYFFIYRCTIINNPNNLNKFLYQIFGNHKNIIVKIVETCQVLG